MATGAVLALAVHGAALFALRDAAPTSRIAADVELEIAMDPAEPPVPPTAEGPVGGRVATATLPVRAPPGAPLARAISAATVDAEGSAPASTYAFSPLGAGADLALGHAIRVGEAPVAPPPAEPPRPGAMDAVREVLHDRDLELGLGPEGPILTALNAATHASRAPLHGSATFEATIDADGHVSALRVIDGADEGWDDARERARVALADRTANLRGRHGAVVRVLVTSRTIEPPKGVLDKVGAIVLLEPGELARKQQRSVHVRLLSVR